MKTTIKCEGEYELEQSLENSPIIFLYKNGEYIRLIFMDEIEEAIKSRQKAVAKEQH